MYPNPQDVLPLPPRPSEEQYCTRARELLRAFADGEPAVRTWVASWIQKLAALRSEPSQVNAREVERFTSAITTFACERLAATSQLTQAQFVIARAHGFANWTTLVEHIRDVETATGTSPFEHAVDVVVTGDIETLRLLIDRQPSLVHEQSAREHHATLLHYVSANGVENYRQRTPANIVDIATLLLDAGANIHAVANVYGGSDTLGLVVTSAHPRKAGVQIALADLLVARGARFDANIVHSCLMNGCPEAAAHMAALGAPVSVVDAAGIGRIDVLSKVFEPVQTIPDSTAAEAMIMAAWYGQVDVVAWLLDHGVPVGARAPKEGHTALHIAAYQGDVGLVELLLSRHAPVNAQDGVYNTPPLV